ncbi:MAG: 5-formyltetrahydrofolate cyclo-ligase [Desulfobacterales bacterium S3730MH5]|nr:MAG: 5-formyltetrahydrofolate cyclo-ligase [Desulfobacterales bacterium S3730MH5]OEU79012.1 MAG: 5-formyltetrahydrofolate cyclo-ligase [Desulfobacterales bacterium S5133MH4]OEU82923.1 MAG: 5-formyltetrahydrofolate cyclo-ligase [Desulfobulbaceae bacterium C00003063]
MEDIKAKKAQIRGTILAVRDALSKQERSEKSAVIMGRLFEFANFVEARMVLFYMSYGSEVDTEPMVRKVLELEKMVALPLTDKKKGRIVPFKIENLDRDIRPRRGIREPIPDRCKQIPVEQINLAIIPGVAFDGRGGRIGYGRGFYDRFIPELDITTRKVALAFECQMATQVPMESHDRYVDIIITEKRIIYKI